MAIGGIVYIQFMTINVTQKKNTVYGLRSGEDNEKKKKKIPQHHCRFRLKLPHFRSLETIKSVQRERRERRRKKGGR